MVVERIKENDPRMSEALMGPTITEAMDQVHRVMGHHAHLPSFGKCLVYELWLGQVEFQVLHPESPDMPSGHRRFLFLFPSGLLMELIDALEPDDAHRTRLCMSMAQHDVSKGILLCIQAAAPLRVHAMELQ
jgi:hypothetical protein